ncbi:unnamed protein product [Miscanthus lutarioriparius]|uniref:HMG box domain-containing protein n=1 Tax=Miscanthus lutarioriparius TaxID=422564 RepID=A0A811NAV3_9POAL|nr:unnamed protein product [Miscanthus lutarioriparius]
MHKATDRMGPRFPTHPKPSKQPPQASQRSRTPSGRQQHAARRAANGRRAPGSVTWQKIQIPRKCPPPLAFKSRPLLASFPLHSHQSNTDLHTVPCTHPNRQTLVAIRPQGLEMKARARSSGGDSRLSVRKSKAEKDPNKPKRPPSAFFVFMEEFRKDYKEKHPNVKQVSVIGKAGGDKWKSLSDAEKAPYVSKAEKLKAEYTKKIDAYNNKQSGGPTASGDSDKSKSEVNDEDEEVRESKSSES